MFAVVEPVLPTTLNPTDWRNLVASTALFVIWPVTRLSHIADEVSLGKLDTPGFAVKGSDEIAALQRGIELGVHKLNFVMSVSETHNMKNVRRPPEDSVTDFKAIVELVKSQPEGKRPIIVGGLSTALGCSYEGRVAVSQVVKYAKQLVEAGADELVVADTVGYADPNQVREVFKAVLSEVGPVIVGGHGGAARWDIACWHGEPVSLP